MRRFPALYRMPVVYLAAAVVVATFYAIDAFALGRYLGKSRAASIPQRLPLSEPKVETPRPIPEASPVPLASPADLILRNPDGLRRKVLVTGRHVVPRPTPNGEESGRSLAPNSIWFVYGETPTMRQLGLGTGRPEGWVFVEDIVEWNTRLMARPTNRSSRPVIEFYKEQACLASAMNGQECPRHSGQCPLETENAVGGSASLQFGWPILNFGTIIASSSPRTVAEVALLPSETILKDAERLAPLRPALRQVYVVFVLDTTASMKATIEAARTLAKALTTAVSQQFDDVTLHLALIEYRDNAPGLGFKARVATPFTDATGFRAVINSLEAALREDLTPGEAVFDGIKLALPGAPGGLEWPTGRSGELATKFILLLGDSPDHARDLDQATALAARARAAGISIATVALDTPGSLSKDDQSRFLAQWRALAEGAYRPPDRANSFVRPLPALTIRVDGAASLAPRVQALIEDRVDRARGLAELAAAEDEGRLDAYLHDHGLTRAQATPVLDDLRRGDIAPKRTQRHVPALRSGWLAERTGDTQFVTKEVWISRDEVNALIQRLSGPPGDVNELRAIVNAAVAGELEFLSADLLSLSTEDQARRRRSFPSLHPQAGDQAERLRSAVRELSKRRDTFPWNDPTQTIESRAAIPFELIDF